MRDRVIIHRIAEAYSSGKSPLVVYDGSYVVTLTPVPKSFIKKLKCKPKKCIKLWYGDG